MLLKMISLDGDFYKFGGNYFDVNKPTIGVAYSYDDFVLPFFGEWLGSGKPTIPGIYLEKKNQKKSFKPNSISYRLRREFIIEPHKSHKEEYSLKSIKDISILDMLKDGDIKRQEVMETSSDADIYRPAIQPKDDLGMRVLKLILNKKVISVKDYDHRFDKPYSRSNTTKMIDFGGTLKLAKLEELADIFDFGFMIGIYDKSGVIPNPIDKDGVKRIHFLNYGDDIDPDKVKFEDLEFFVPEEPLNKNNDDDEENDYV